MWLYFCIICRVLIYLFCINNFYECDFTHGVDTSSSQQTSMASMLKCYDTHEFWLMEFIEFRHTHHSLLAQLGRWRWLMKMRLDWRKPEDTRYDQIYYIEIRPDAPGVWAKDLIPNFAIIENRKLGNGQCRHSLECPGRGCTAHMGAAWIWNFPITS